MNSSVNVPHYPEQSRDQNLSQAQNKWLLTSHTKLNRDCCNWGSVNRKEPP